MDKKQLEKIARMAYANIPQTQIAAAMSVTEGFISQIMESAEYKTEIDKIVAEKFEESQLVDQGWDGIEALGIRATVEALQHNPDPDFALRAAVVANKAVRRSQHRNQPINPDLGARTVVHLKQVFVNKLQNATKEIAERTTTTLQDNQKETDFLEPSKVQELLANQENKLGALGYDPTKPITSAEQDAEDMLKDSGFDE